MTVFDEINEAIFILKSKINHKKVLVVCSHGGFSRFMEVAKRLYEQEGMYEGIEFFCSSSNPDSLRGTIFDEAFVWGDDWFPEDPSRLLLLLGGVRNKKSVDTILYSMEV
jgi:hypothetical protein